METNFKRSYDHHLTKKEGKRKRERETV